MINYYIQFNILLLLIKFYSSSYKLNNFLSISKYNFNDYY